MSADRDEELATLGLAGQCLSLRAQGRPDPEYPGGAYPTLMQVDAGDLQLRRRCHIYAVPAFCEQLSLIHGQLAGRAELATLDDIAISLEIGAQGHVQVEVAAGDVGTAEYSARVSFHVDQTYLPAFIRDLRGAFQDRATQ